MAILDLKELRMLNRVIRWDEFGIQMEADPRHQEILVATEQGRPLFISCMKEQLWEKQQRSGSPKQRPACSVLMQLEAICLASTA